ncbi:MAG: hypothetical protein AB8F94_02625 [Saprospiraceae bacterium]
MKHPRQFTFSSIPVSIYSLLFFFFFFFLCGSWKSIEVEETSSPLITFPILIACIVGFFMVREAIIRYSERLMMELSKDEEREHFLTKKYEERPATHQPKLLNINSQQELEGDLAQATKQREKVFKQLTKLWWKKLLYIFFIVLGYITLPFLTFKLLNTNENATNEASFFVIHFVRLYFLFTVVQLFVLYKEFRQLGNPKRMRFYSIIAVLRRLTSPRIERIYLNILFVSIIIINITINLNEPTSAVRYTGIAFLIMAFIHRQLYRYLRQYANKIPAIKLTILRVFGREENNKFTFSRLLQYWKHIGPSYTVIDPYYLLHTYRFSSSKGIKILLSVFLLIFLIKIIFTSIIKYADIQMSKNDFENFTLVIIVALAWWLYWLYWKYKMNKRFAKNEESIKKQFAAIEKRPRNWDLSYKDLHINCFDNTWKLAVNAFVKSSDAILMDLRGFSNERKGCEYEVNFIIDTFPIEGIVFLVDSNSEKELIHQLILDQWKDQRQDSPNLKSNKSNATIFVSEKEDYLDLQFLIDLLINSSQIIKGLKNSN